MITLDALQPRLRQLKLSGLKEGIAARTDEAAGPTPTSRVTPSATSPSAARCSLRSRPSMTSVVHSQVREHSAESRPPGMPSAPRMSCSWVQVSKRSCPERPGGKASMSASAASPLRSQSSRIASGVHERRLSTCAAVHGSVATPSTLPWTRSSQTPATCESTSRTRQAGVAGDGPSSASTCSRARAQSMALASR